VARPNPVKSIDANDRPRVKKIPALGAQISWMRHLTTRLAPLLLFNSMGKGAGLEGVLLVSVPTMPVPILKRGAYQAGCLESNLLPGRHPRGR